MIENIDVPAAVRGGSTGFSILLIGGLLAPIVVTAVPALGGVWLTATAIVAFIVAGMRVGSARWVLLHGAVAALLAYLLVLPLVLLNETGRAPVQIALTIGTAIGVGALAGWVRNRQLSRGR